MRVNILKTASPIEMNVSWKPFFLSKKDLVKITKRRQAIQNILLLVMVEIFEKCWQGTPSWYIFYIID